MAAMNSIELRRLSKSFRGTGRVVDDVSIAVREGEFVTLLGPSGCGKTTTLRLIAGFEYPDAGQIFVNGQDVTSDPPYRRPVNTVFQDYALFPHMTVEKNVAYGMWVSGDTKAETARRAAEALHMVGLSDKASARPAELSGGQRQRVALARAIVRQPRVLLLDEPLSALDAKLREAMQVELKHLHRRLGITFLLVTHDQTEAMVMSDRIMVMEKGRVVQAGSPVELYDRPETAYVANFLGTSNLLEGKAAGTAGDRLTVVAAGTRFSVRPGNGDVAAGEAVMLAIRPEKCVLAAAPPDLKRMQGVLAGRIIEHLFQGNLVRTSIDIGTGAPFLVDTQLGSIRANPALLPSGSSCIVTTDQESIVVFPGGTSS